MNLSSPESSALAAPQPAPGPFARGRRRGAAPWAARSVHRLLSGMRDEALLLHDARGQHLLGHGPAAPGLALQVHDDRVYGRTLRDGDIGFAEAYLDGQWDSPDLPGLLKLLMRQRGALRAAVYGRGWARLLHRAWHGLNRNTRAGSRRNIRAHYDLGNDFYALWLDPSWNYSSAWWGDHPELSLAQAQQRKMDRALAEVGVAPGSGAGRQLLEIGCGWGAVAERAAQHGARLTGVTLSTEQLAFARRRLAEAGLAERAELRLQDYRDLAAEAAAGRRYDGIVSIEMVEAVGEAWWPTYFDTLRACLAPGGRACVQSIVIADPLFDDYRRGSDFIQRHVFPGGMLPSRAAFVAQARRAGLELVGELAFGQDYARTLALWARAFEARREQVRALGHDERFVRLWRFYLAYCEAAFATRQTDVVQFTLRAR